jgi:hypothetical protein
MNFSPREAQFSRAVEATGGVCLRAEEARRARPSNLHGGKIKEASRFG